MRRNFATIASLVALFGIVCLAAPAMAQPKAPNIPEDLLEGKLLTTHKRQIGKRIAWWQKKIMAAQTPQEIIEARQNLLADYNRYDSENYQEACVEFCKDQLLDILKGKGLDINNPLSSLKQLNVAIAFSQMNNRDMQPVFDVMIESKDQAIRFLGWKGYRNSQKQILRTRKAIKSYMDSVNKALKNEENPIVLGNVFHAMNIVGDVRKKYQKATQKDILDTFKATWDNRCKQVLAAPSEEMLSAMRNGVTTLAVLGKNMSEDKAATQATLQMIANLAINSSRAYDKMLSEEDDIKAKLSKVDDDKKKALEIRKAKLEDLHKSFNSMLLNCENALNTIAGTNNTFFANALKAEVELGAAVRTAGLDWLDALKPFGVTKPGAKKVKASK